MKAGHGLARQPRVVAQLRQELEAVRASKPVSGPEKRSADNLHLTFDDVLPALAKYERVSRQGSSPLSSEQRFVEGLDAPHVAFYRESLNGGSRGLLAERAPQRRILRGDRELCRQLLHVADLE